MSKRKSNNKRQRDSSHITSSLLSRSSLLDIEDRRSFHPLQDYRPAKGSSKLASVLYVRPVGDRKPAKAKSKWSPETFSFTIPKKVSLCVRRHQRREVLFALKKTGKGSRKRERRRNYFSDVSCK